MKLIKVWRCEAFQDSTKKRAVAKCYTSGEAVNCQNHRDQLGLLIDHPLAQLTRRGQWLASQQEVMKCQ